MSTVIHSANLDSCWVCGTAFVEAGGSAHKEVHHIVPVAYGGKDGPTVDLCDTHHTALHKIALALRSKKHHGHLLGTQDRDQIRKLLWLATRVNLAEAATRNDPNKKMDVLVSLDCDTKEKLEGLARMFPKVRGRAALIKMAIHALYNQHMS